MATKEKKVFISHASKDEAIVQKVVELLEDIGLTEVQVVCSSIPGYGIPLGKDIYDWLAQQFREYDLHVLFMLSSNYYNSIACQNEMGAAWVLKSRYDSILLPGFEYCDIKGAVNPNQISIKLDGNEEILKQHLNELKDKLVAEFELAMPAASRWERHRQTFIAAIASLPAQADNPGKQLDDIGPIFVDSIKLTKDAEKLLIQGVGDPYGEIRIIRVGGGVFISANKESFCHPDGGPRLEAKWMGALEELEKHGFIRATSYKRTIFNITREGYDYADSITGIEGTAIAPVRSNQEEFL